MRFSVRFLRYRGRPLPRREVANRPALSGDLRIEECMDDELRRNVRMARLVDMSDVRPSNTTPTLLDVQIVAMSPQAFTLNGFERIDGTDFAQSWLVGLGD